MITRRASLCLHGASSETPQNRGRNEPQPPWGLPVGRRVGTGARRGSLARSGRRAFGPGEQRGQFLALAALAVEQLGTSQRLAVEPLALDVAALVVDRFPDEADRLLVALDGLVGELLGLLLRRLGPAEAVDQCRGRGQNLALVILRQQLVRLHVVVNRDRVLAVLLHALQALVGFAKAFATEPAHLAHVSFRCYRVVAEAPHQLLAPGVLAV